MEYEYNFDQMRQQLEATIQSGQDEHIEAHTGKPVLQILKDLENVEVVFTSNQELIKRNHILFKTTLVLGSLCILLFSCGLILFFKGAAPDCSVYRFNTNNRGVQCVGPDCFKR